MPPLADPSEFAISVAIGSAHVLRSALDSLAAATRSPIAAALLALPVLAAYLAAVTLAFAVRVAADCYTRVVVAACGCPGGDAPATVVHHTAAAVLGWLGGIIARLAVAALLFGAGAIACALFHLSSVVPSSPLIAASV